ncbi:MAG: hypothetical protein FWF11_04490, partial [Coriobacteriia bacterium]|nr:hypothetical protein [Coriobacteriia bacterium]
MNFFTRAFVSITRNFGKTILLLLIVFALGCVISGAISVQQAVRNTDINLRAGMPVVATIDQDFEAIQESAAMGQLPEVISGLGPQLLDEIGSLQQVRRFDYFIEATLLSAELELVVPSDGAPVHFEEMGEEWTPLILRGVRSPTFLEL